MTRQMPAGAQVAFAKDWFERQGIPAETIDVESYIDRSLSYEENIKNLRRQFGAGKRGMDAPKVARGMTAAECDVAIGNFEDGYNGMSARDACTCGYQDACDKLERQRAEKAAAKHKPAAMEPTATEVAWLAVNAQQRAVEAKKTAAAEKAKTAEPVRITEEESYEVVRRTVVRDLTGKRVSDKKLREYADKHGFPGGWVESAYYTIKPSRSIESIERDIRKTEEKAYERSKSSRAQGGSRPGGGALDRDMQRIWERGRIFKDELERAKQQQAAATPKAAKPAPAPDMPPLLTAPPELAADVLGGGMMGLTPTAAPGRKPAARTTRKPKTTPAAPKPKKQPKKTAAPKRKTTKKTAKPKAKKTAAGTKLTPAQQEYMAIQGFVMVKRGGKYVRVTD